MRLKKSYKGNLIAMTAKPVRGRQLIERGLQPDWSIAYALFPAHGVALRRQTSSVTALAGCWGH